MDVYFGFSFLLTSDPFPSIQADSQPIQSRVRYLRHHSRQFMIIILEKIVALGLVQKENRLSQWPIPSQYA